MRTDSQGWEDDSGTGLAVAAEKSLKLAARNTKIHNWLGLLISQDYEEFSKILLNKDAGDHERVQVTKIKRKIATHAKKDVRLGASADESKDSAH